MLSALTSACCNASPWLEPVKLRPATAPGLESIRRPLVDRVSNLLILICLPDFMVAQLWKSLMESCAIVEVARLKNQQRLHLRWHALITTAASLTSPIMFCITRGRLVGMILRIV
ncbi:hypothetical protein QAD02_002592 [Eretmocerus hayati]|uniref:Uncharacterized protein n=1 Tax=Eretmocerus hayati TaxID=131215 RepID=A0ACC2NJF4_9HYME|nr:hypothetical protein QAD02_002592 [Eretmocerus hayati]